MLSTSTFSSSSPHAFLPAVPSPLSPRSANIYGRGPAYMSPSDEKQERSPKAVPYSKRPVKKVPSPKHDELKERRRNLFLKKVRDGREDKRFEARGEDMMRLDFVQRQKQWEADRARDAPQFPSEPPEADDEDGFEEHNDDALPTSSNAMQLSAPSTQQPFPEEEVDEVLQREDEELEALISYMPTNDDASKHLWSDDDDYDALFYEFMEHDETTTGGQQGTPRLQDDQDDQAMDVS